MEIIKREHNLETFLEICDQLTLKPLISNDFQKDVIKMFHPIFISVLTRLEIVKDPMEDTESAMCAMHRKVLKEFGQMFIVDDYLKKTVNAMAKIAFGRDGCKTDVQYCWISFTYIITIKRR